MNRPAVVIADPFPLYTPFPRRSGKKKVGETRPRDKCGYRACKTHAIPLGRGGGGGGGGEGTQYQEGRDEYARLACARRRTYEGNPR